MSNNNISQKLQQAAGAPQIIPQNLGKKKSTLNCSWILSDAIREKAVAIKSCMELTDNEVQQLILGGLVVKVSNRKKPDQSLKYSCKFCIWYNHETNGQVNNNPFCNQRGETSGKTAKFRPQGGNKEAPHATFAIWAIPVPVLSLQGYFYNKTCAKFFEGRALGPSASSHEK